MLDAIFAFVDVVFPYFKAIGIGWNWISLSVALYIGTTGSFAWGFKDRAGIFIFGVVCVFIDLLTAPIFGQDRIELLTLTTPAAHYTAAGYGLMFSPFLSYGIRSFRQRRNAVDSS